MKILHYVTAILFLSCIFFPGVLTWFETGSLTQTVYMTLIAGCAMSCFGIPLGLVLLFMALPVVLIILGAVGSCFGWNRPGELYEEFYFSGGETRSTVIILGVFVTMFLLAMEAWTLRELGLNPRDLFHPKTRQVEAAGIQRIRSSTLQQPTETPLGNPQFLLLRDIDLRTCASVGKLDGFSVLERECNRGKAGLLHRAFARCGVSSDSASRRTPKWATESGGQGSMATARIASN